MCTLRPAVLGRDPWYATSDPGHEYIPGVMKCFLGTLAAAWGIEGKKATMAQRADLYEGRHPVDGTVLLPHVDPDQYRPVKGGNFHASKQLDAWLAHLDDASRKQAERVFAECAVEVLKSHILPDVRIRTGHAGQGERLPADTIAVAFKHTTNSARQYHLHVLFEVSNLGRAPDGRYRTIDADNLYRKQAEYSREFRARLIDRFREELGVTLVRDGKDLGVPGFEAVRNVKTARQEEMDRELAQANLPRTPKTLHWAAAKTHRARTQENAGRTTTEQAAANSRRWYWSRGLNLHRVFQRAGATLTRWADNREARAAIRDTVRSIDRTGRDMERRDFEAYARCEAALRGVNLRRFERRLQSALRRPDEIGLVQTAQGRLSTQRVESARVAWGKTFLRHRHESRNPPTWLASAHARHELRRYDPQVVADTRDLTSRRRVARVEGVSHAVELAAKAFRYDGRRVFVAAARPRAAGARSVNGQVTCPTLLAAELAKGSLWKTFLAVRSERWTSLDHVVRLYKSGRRPAERLKKSDLLVIETEGASQYALKKLMKAAAKAKATVFIVSPDPIVTTNERQRQQAHQHDGHER